MAAGMEMVMKMMGLDAAQVGDAVKQFQDTLALFNAKMDTIISNQQMMYQLMVDKGLIDTVETFQAKPRGIDHDHGNC